MADINTQSAQPPNPPPPGAPAPSQAVTLSQKFGITLDQKGNLDLPSLGFVLQASGFFPDVQKASQGMVKVILGRELGIPAITAVIGIHILTNNNGKVSVMVGSHLKAGKIKKSDSYDYDVEESTAEKCVLIPKMKNPETGKWEAKKPVTFTIQQAQKMKVGGYGKDGAKFQDNSNWAKAPEDMLFHRCLSRMEKMHFPDISTVPTYTPDELGFREDERGEAIVVEGNLVRDEDGLKVPVDKQAAESEEKQEEKQPERPKTKATPVIIAKLQALTKKHKWTNEQFFDMLIHESGVLDKAAAQTALEAQNWKQLHENIAGDESTVEKVIGKIMLGPDMYIDARSNPPEPGKKDDGEKGEPEQGKQA